ncbi:hypothetical protein NQZ68_018108 [Dissostichus eleginoides]|nr:hypothetical protein NQZ68_018108 [Dissostichus eleginoides]
MFFIKQQQSASCTQLLITHQTRGWIKRCLNPSCKEDSVHYSPQHLHLYACSSEDFRHKDRTRLSSPFGFYWTVDSKSEKMIFIILLLLFLTSCVSGTVVVNVTQASYQAEENQNITLEWTFSTRRETSLRSISTICFLHTNDRPSVLFELREGVESPESQDPQFAGRVQWDKDVLTEGRLTLHVSRLRTNDSGFYVCDILTPDGTNSRRCWLSVTDSSRSILRLLLSSKLRDQQRVHNQRERDQQRVHNQRDGKRS